MIYNRGIKIVFVLIITWFFAHTASAYVAGSSNYRIDIDAISVGGLRATSTSYIEQSTLATGISGTSTGSSYSGTLGYLQAGDFYISLSNSSSVSLSPNMKVSTGGQSTGSGSATVTTDNTSGYALYINASTDPAFKSSQSSFLDYVTTTPGTPDFSWSVGSGSSGFGFSPEGADIVSLFKDNGTSCGVGGSDTSGKCWYPLSTSIKKISQSASANAPGGVATTIKFMAEAGSSAQKTAGNYTSTVVITAVAL